MWRGIRRLEQFEDITHPRFSQKSWPTCTAKEKRGVRESSAKVNFFLAKMAFSRWKNLEQPSCSVVGGTSYMAHRQFLQWSDWSQKKISWAFDWWMDYLLVSLSSHLKHQKRTCATRAGSWLQKCLNEQFWWKCNIDDNYDKTHCFDSIINSVCLSAHWGVKIVCIVIQAIQRIVQRWIHLNTISIISFHS